MATLSRCTAKIESLQLPAAACRSVPCGSRTTASLPRWHGTLRHEVSELSSNSNFFLVNLPIVKRLPQGKAGTGIELEPGVIGLQGVVHAINNHDISNKAKWCAPRPDVQGIDPQKKDLEVETGRTFEIQSQEIRYSLELESQLDLSHRELGESPMASSSHHEFTDAVSEDNDATTKNHHLRLGTMLETLAEYLVPQCVQTASIADWVAGMLMVAILLHTAWYHLVPGTLQGIEALQEQKMVQTDIPALAPLHPATEQLASIVDEEAEKEVVESIDMAEKNQDMHHVQKCAQKVQEIAEAAIVEHQQDNDTALACVQDPPATRGEDPGKKCEPPKEDLVGIQFASHISAYMNPPLPEHLSHNKSVEDANVDEASKFWVATTIQVHRDAVMSHLSPVPAGTGNELQSGGQCETRPVDMPLATGPLLCLRYNSNTHGLAQGLLMPTDSAKETPLDPRARMPYFVNGALEHVFFPLLIAFPLCATVVIVLSALFTSGAGCCKMMFWLQGDVKQSINRSRTPSSVQSAQLATGTRTTAKTCIVHKTVQLSAARAIKQGPVYKTIERRGNELKDKAVEMTESFFSLHLPFEDINSEAYHDFVRFVAGRAFFALLQDADARIQNSFEHRPEMVDVHDAAYKAMKNDPKWPELESLALDIEPAQHLS